MVGTRKEASRDRYGSVVRAPVCVRGETEVEVYIKHHREAEPPRLWSRPGGRPGEGRPVETPDCQSLRFPWEWKAGLQSGPIWSDKLPNCPMSKIQPGWRPGLVCVILILIITGPRVS